MRGFIARLGVSMTYGVSAVLVAVLISLLIILQVRTEAALSGVVATLPIGFAVAAGIVASINPCGFFMLPGYVAYQLGVQEAGYGKLSAVQRGMRALVVGLMATLGFVFVFAIVGVIVSAGGAFLSRVFPFLGLVIGVRPLSGMQCGVSCGVPSRTFNRPAPCFWLEWVDISSTTGSSLQV